MFGVCVLKLRCVLVVEVRSFSCRDCSTIGHRFWIGRFPVVSTPVAFTMDLGDE